MVGDLNDTADSAPLKPLLQGTDLRDVSTHATFISDGRPGTYGTGSKSNKIDHILLSPALFNNVTSASVFRKGVWGGKNGTLFEHYPTMTEAVEAAWDHAAVVADISASRPPSRPGARPSWSDRSWPRIPSNLTCSRPGPSSRASRSSRAWGRGSVGGPRR